MNGMASFVPRGQVHVHGHTKNLADNLDGSCAYDRWHVSAIPAVNHLATISVQSRVSREERPSTKQTSVPATINERCSGGMS